MSSQGEKALRASDPNAPEVGWIVTIKLPRHPNHDPRNKISGECPVHGATCTDLTGQHHSFLIRDTDLWKLDTIENLHVTRVEGAVMLQIQDIALLAQASTLWSFRNLQDL